MLQRSGLGALRALALARTAPEPATWTRHAAAGRRLLETTAAPATLRAGASVCQHGVRAFCSAPAPSSSGLTSADAGSATGDMTTPPPPPSQGLPSNLRFSNPEVLDVKEDEDLEFEYLIEKGPKSAPLLSLTPECSFSEAGNIDLNEFVFSTPMREDVIHNVVVWQRAKRRRGLAKQKNRSEVSGSTRKPFPQKGTGRARQGSTRAPHMRGGAVALAARGNRDFSYKLNKKYVRLGLRSVLSARLYEGNLIVVDTLEPEVAAAPAPAADADESAGEVVVEAATSRLSIRTKHVAAMLEDQDWGSALFVDTDERSEHFRLAVSNVPNAHVLPQIGLNVYDILSFEKIVIKREALEALYRRLDENIRKIYFSR